MAACVFCDPVRLPEEQPTLIAEFEHSVAVLNHNQRFHGQSLLILKPHIEDLLAIPGPAHAAYNDELHRLARAVRVTAPCHAHPCLSRR